MKALTSATRSWLTREVRRTRRPTAITGSTTSGANARTISVSFRLVISSSPSAPTSSSALRTASEKPKPITACSTVVSLVRREITSPVRVDSK